MRILLMIGLLTSVESELARMDAARAQRDAEWAAKLTAVPKYDLVPSVQKGSIAPFDRIPLMDGSGSAEKLRQPYAKSVWVQAAIRKVIAPVTAVQLQFFGDARGGKQVISDPGLLQFWQAPARGPRQGTLSISEVIDASLGWLELSGEFFWLLDSTPVPFPEVSPTGGLKPFIIARPDRMRPVISQGEMMGWEFTDGAGRKTGLPTEQVIQVKLWNPYDEWRGLAPWLAAEIASEADYLAGRFNLNLMQNNGDTGPIIVGKSGMPDDAQQKHITELLRMKKEMSLRGQFRPIFLGGDITVEDPKVKTPDASFVQVRLENRHEIFIAFGVPPSMADVKAAYSIGSASDHHALIVDTCQPVGEKLCDAIEVFLKRTAASPKSTSPQSRRSIYASFDWARHPVMVAARNERIDNGVKFWSTGMPWKDISEYLDLRLPEFEGWDKGYLPFSVAPVGSEALEAAQNPTEDPALAEEEDGAPEDGASGKAVGEMLSVLRGSHPSLCLRASVAKNKALWEKHMRLRAASVRQLQSKASNVINQHRGRTLSLLQLSSPEMLKGLATEAQRHRETNSSLRLCDSVAFRSLIDVIFEPKKFGVDLFKGLQPGLKTILEKAGAELLAEVGAKDDAWKFPSQDVLKFLTERQQPVQDCGETARKQLNTALEEAALAGESLSEITNRVRGVFNNLSKFEAKRIAMTETNIAYNVARQEGMKAVGITRKAWLSSHGPNVRPTHRQAEIDYSPENAIPIDEAFRVGGEDLQFPGDPSGSAGNIINCQCIQLAVKAEEEES